MNQQPNTLTRRFTIIFSLLLVFGVSVGAQSNIIINEVYTGDPDFIELANNGLNTIDLSGWTLETGFAYTLYPTYTVPSGTLLQPGACLVLVESSSTLSGTGTTPPNGAQIINTGLSWGWVGNSSGCVAIIDANGSCQDLVVFGTGGGTTLPGAVGHTFTNPINRAGNNVSLDDALYRISGIDTDSGADWANGSDGDETPGQANVGQVLGPVDITNIVVDPGSHPQLLLDSATSTFSVNAQIAELHTTAGIVIDNGVAEGLIGGTLSISGNFYSPTGSGLSGMILSPATVILKTADQTDQLTLTTLFQSTASLTHELVGARPTAIRELVSSIGMGSVRTGSSSRALDSISTFIASETLSMIMQDGSTPSELISLTRSYVTPQALFAATMQDLGNGQLALGSVGVPSGHQLYNIFALNSSIPLGSGPLLGIDLGSFQLAQIALPVGQAPFHVWADANGNYSFATSQGVVPAGLSLDCVTFAVGGSSLSLTPATRLTF